jgi:hypothetical protein
MVERARTHTSQQAGDPLPASFSHILACVRCDSATWRVATIDEDSIVYHCVNCGAAMRIIYDAATMAWTAVVEEP